MDGLFELLMDIAEIYLDLAENLMPQKNFSKGTKRFLTVLCSIMSIGMVACIIAGGFLIVSDNGVLRVVGLVLLILAFILILVHIIIGVYNKKKKKNKLQ